MKQFILFAFLLVVVLIVGGMYIYGNKAPSYPDKSAFITVESPTKNALVQSPLVIKGQARGSWYFEASFPVHVEDEQGNKLGEGIAQAQGDWMTPEFVPFEATVVFKLPESRRGTLVLEKDNPSGLPENADEARIPVRFQKY